MRTAILVVLVAASFTAGVTAPTSQNHAVESGRDTHVRASEIQKQIPNATIGELLEKILASAAAIDVAVNAAAAELEAALAGVSAALQQVAALLQAAEAEAESIVAAAVSQAQSTPVAELPVLVQATIAQLEQLIQAIAQEVQSIVYQEAAALVPQVEAIVNQLVADVQAAVQPVVDIIGELIGSKAIGIVAPKATVGELIEDVILAALAVRDAFAVAAEQLHAVLTGVPGDVLKEIITIITNTAAEYQAIWDYYNEVAAGLDYYEWIVFVGETLTKTDELLTAAFKHIVVILRPVAADVLPQVETILNQLNNAAKSAIQPVLDILKELIEESRAVATIGPVVALIKQSTRGIQVVDALAPLIPPPIKALKA